MECLNKFKDKKIFIALGSASKNARMVLERLKITGYFNAISDGTRAIRAKPDPEVFKIAQMIWVFHMINAWYLRILLQVSWQPKQPV